jgi:hypothetical protein
MDSQQMIDDAHQNYVKETMFDSNPKWLEPIPVMDMQTGEKIMGARQYSKEEFINKCKTDSEFSEKWGLKIEERELSLEERRILWNKKVDPSENACEYVDGLSIVDAHDIFNQDNVSTKLITLTYNNETIESYE